MQEGEAESIISSLSIASNNSFNGNSLINDDASDSGNDVFAFNGGALSAISQPLAFGGTTSRLSNVFGAASISGGLATPIGSFGTSFAEKFSNIGQATKDVEKLGNISRLPLKNSRSRRTSFLTSEETVNTRVSPLVKKLNSSTSLSETYSTRNNLLDRIESYSKSPTEQQISNNNEVSNSERSSVNFSLDENLNNAANENTDGASNKPISNVWNPASTHSFTPMFGLTDSNQLFNPNQPFIPYGYPMGQFPPPSMPMMGMGPPIYANNPVNNNHAVNDNGDNGSKETLDNKTSNNAKNDNQGDSDLVENIQNSMDPVNHYPITSQMMPNGMPPIPPMNYPGFAPYGMIPLPPYDPTQPPPLMSSPSVSKMNSDQKSQKNNSPSPPSSQSPSAESKTHNHNHKNEKAKRSNKGSTSPVSGSSRRKNNFYRSPLLEQFRNNKTNKQYTLSDIFENAVEFSKDQHGSRFIQQEMEKASSEEKEVFFNQIRDVSVELMKDVFGNYVIQRYFELGSEVQRDILFENMKGKFLDLSVQMYGCRVVQRAFVVIKPEQRLIILNELKNDILACIKDQNANHVVQKCIETIPYKNTEFILDIVKEHIYHLSTNPYGCRVIQRLLENSDDMGHETLLNELSRYIFYLILDQYGNYVIQHVLSSGPSIYCSKIADIVKDNVVGFSKHKFASNVVEKVMINGDEERRNSIVDAVLKGNESDDFKPVDDKSALALMIKDQYANYVIQKLVDLAHGEKKVILIKKIRVYLDQISSENNYGKHLASIEKLQTLCENASKN